MSTDLFEQQWSRGSSRINLDMNQNVFAFLTPVRVSSIPLQKGRVRGGRERRKEGREEGREGRKGRKEGDRKGRKKGSVRTLKEEEWAVSLGCGVCVHL
jgi:hypothetical protein